MSRAKAKGWFWPALLTLNLLLVSGCGSLLPKAAPPLQVYALEGAQDTPVATVAGASSANAPTLILNPPHAAPGYESQHIVYIKTAHQLGYFAHSEWVATPARMLVPILVAALDTTGSFRAIGLASSGIVGDLRLDTEILRLHQAFDDVPSRVRFTLRATLSDYATRQVIAWQEFDESVPSASEDPYGGVVAANSAVQRVTTRLAHFCTQVLESWRASRPVTSQPLGSR